MPSSFLCILVMIILFYIITKSPALLFVTIARAHPKLNIIAAYGMAWPNSKLLAIYIFISHQVKYGNLCHKKHLNTGRKLFNFICILLNHHCIKIVFIWTLNIICVWTEMLICYIVLEMQQLIWKKLKLLPSKLGNLTLFCSLSGNINDFKSSDIISMFVGDLIISNVDLMKRSGLDFKSIDSLLIVCYDNLSLKSDQNSSTVS